MKNFLKTSAALTATSAVILVTLLFHGCSLLAIDSGVTVAEGIKAYEGVPPPYVKTSGGARIHLTNKKDASDPTWQELEAFLLQDDTDKADYSLLSYPCGAFAENLHNNAEIAGIKAAWVAVDFNDGTEGHALNAFNTLDKGLVYVDCTGKDVLSVDTVTAFEDEEKIFGGAGGWDKIAYIEVGERYGLVSLEVASAPDYDYYEEYEQDLQAFENLLQDYNRDVSALNSEIASYNDWVQSRSFRRGSNEALKALEWVEGLKAKEEELAQAELELNSTGTGLGAFWEPMGIIQEVKIYW